MSRDVVVKNAFGVLNKKKKKNVKSSSKEATETIEEPVISFTDANDWGDEADNVGNDCFFDDGFALPTKVAKIRAVEEEPVQKAEPEYYSESEEESQSESSDEENNSEILNLETERIVTSKIVPQVQKKEEDLDALLQEFNIKNTVAQKVKVEAKKTDEEKQVNELDNAAEAALASMLPTATSSKNKKKKKKKKNKPKTTEKTEVETSKTKPMSAKDLVEAEKRARLNKLKKKKDKSKFNQIPSHLMN